MVQFFLKWLRIERPRGIAPYAGAALELPIPADLAITQSREAIENVLGGSIERADATRIDARFGLVNSEQLTVTVEPLDSARCHVRIQARRGAAGVPREESRNVRALVEHLRAFRP